MVHPWKNILGSIWSPVTLLNKVSFSPNGKSRYREDGWQPSAVRSQDRHKTWPVSCNSFTYLKNKHFCPWHFLLARSTDCWKFHAETRSCTCTEIWPSFSDLPHAEMHARDMLSELCCVLVATRSSTVKNGLWAVWGTPGNLDGSISLLIFLSLSFG